jgi:cob(I)alamin adenosyltransferase
VLRLQRELFVVGAELATNPDAREKGRDDVSRVSGAMVAGLDALLQEAEARIELPREFIVPGETRLSAALEVARTVLRRAERRAVTLSLHDPALARGRCLQYLNRMADLLWVLARDAERAEAHAATVARPDRRRPGHPAGESEERSQG